MPYFSNGKLVDGRPWNVSTFIAALWGLVNFIVLFFKSLVNPTLTKKSGYTTSFTNSGRPAERGKTIGRVNHGSAGPKSPPMGGG